MTDREGYITMGDAAKKLGVQRATLYYYIKTMDLKTERFRLDKHKYLKVADVERIKELKDAATERAKKSEEAA